jgi:hypothetical protein
MIREARRLVFSVGSGHFKLLQRLLDESELKDAVNAVDMASG